MKMFVCVCRAVTDREVSQVIEDGACTVADVTRQCGAAGDCGACRGRIEEMIEASASEPYKDASAYEEVGAAHRGDILPAAALVRVKAA
jgi:bacterioferritin-associated ferredoxin